MKKILFVCSQNKLRSPTGEAVFGHEAGIEARSAGLNNNAEIPLGAEDVEWADIIFVMEPVHKRKLSKGFKDKLKGQSVICLGIPDHYDYMDPELVAIFMRDAPQFIY
ncbi:low molecular weight protein tyrosine phosphatase family protein [Thalassomonas actiniarum]|uniref:Phosphotyrosine protein phosphatase n=1 Tax=Thalassomonas actiniarum TaxID=485447 RepID=A0AAF0C4M0_9GAMM|nr:phosphotyrosine protein phosphatase [Thalassomonas actiniarum]WDD99969.1 phosphotyrosine protein phosphatase [Thalassomonas actiniarum]